ncbi:hypothetical protein PLESTB_000332600 [Pleodorina starrii]|uniref:Major facilitator superfamily (MFS) profile domain-containing protein n=1 Tax=Pleodorina starrii TaxID=330485 RepID=A0A9W6EYY0_9CHLO|nr:hypothetical protein PLESTM_001881700 [Pleodorina starrii]GLC50009.1 hypothetical protein PLESTB_000332600 [Pleodorina starrii]GLC75144.1 hypothetical protein PLESTF_001598700 [Pleodorina starrii]
MVVLQPAPGAPELMSFRRRLANILGLSMGWCLMVSVVFIQLSTTTLAARDFAGAATATLPAGIMMAAATLSAAPGSLAMKRLGRRPVFAASAAAGVAGGVLLVLGARFRQLGLLIAGSVPLGACFAQANNLRFAATEFAPAGFEPKALSLVVTGAVLAAVVGPEVARHTRAAMEPTYTATYVFLTGLTGLYAVLVGAMIEFGALPELVADKAERAADKAVVTADVTVVDAGSGPAAAQNVGGEAEGAATPPAAAAAAAAAMECGTSSVGGSAVACPQEQQPLHVATTTTTTLPENGVQQAPATASATAPGTAAASAPGSAAPGEQQLTRQLTAASAAKGAGGASSDSTLVVVGKLDCGSTVQGKDADARHADAPADDPGAVISSGSNSSSCSGVRSSQPLRDLFLSWDYVVPVLTASLSYCGMAGMMTASPLAIRDADYSFNETTQVIQVHIISMFLPSLLTGHVIALLGATTTMTAGSAVLLAGTAVFFAGGRLPVFFAGNAVVGLGWNWSYVGASALVAATCSAAPEARFAAQGVMDTAVLAGTGLAVVLAGTLYSSLGWRVYGAVFLGVSGLMLAADLAMAMAGRAAARRRAGEGGSGGGKAS